MKESTIFQNTVDLTQIPERRMLTWSQVHTEDPRRSGAIVLNSFAKATWRKGFVHPDLKRTLH